MGHWTFLNSANAPVNVGIYNGGILYDYRNHLQPYSESSCKAVDPSAWDQLPLTKIIPSPPKTQDGKYLIPDTCLTSFDLAAVGYDVAIAYDTPMTEFDKKNNWSWIATIGTLAAGTILTAAGAALTFATAGAAAPVLVAGIEVTAGASALIAGGGLVVSIASGATAAVQAAMAPATFRGWYGAKDYSFAIKGGFVLDSQDGKAIIKDATKLSVDWSNAKTGEKGTVTA